ncbi:hypothetical protein [Microbacterium sp. JZ31]|uniref:hypothetical protein n=1 Tax=Microbacterium sp. JZ31 TaxID=1906274 RepID=UPI0019331859|nr:hypothetical protein [Microbacterium sp. JZ31]
MTEKEPGALSQFFGALTELVKDAARLEWQTEAGRINFYGMVLALLVVLAFTLFGTLDLIAQTILAALGRAPAPVMTNPLDAVWVFMVFTLACVAMLGVLVVTSRRSDRKEDSGEH